MPGLIFLSAATSIPCYVIFVLDKTLISMLFKLKRLVFPEIRVCGYYALRFSSLEALKSVTPPEFCDEMKVIEKNDLETLVLKQYNHGKFCNLVESVIATPRVLLSACRNLIVGSNGGNSDNVIVSDLIHNRIEPCWISNMARELREGEFDVEACCVRMLPSRKKGETLILPNLKLKVVIEAMRMVLEVIYEKRFATFAYGGRVGMGRHTALRYLKSSLENPNWWFRVVFHRKKFGVACVEKLVSIMEEKIEDALLIDLVNKLFKFEAVYIEYGGCYMGRGLPQECSLSSILVNIYFNGFDREIQGFRSQIDLRNPRFDSKDLVGDSTSEGVPVIFHKPVKLYACRYLDEILVITSGSKMLAMDIKNQVVEFLERVLGLKVNRLETALHSAVSEKIHFLGMELQAVPPSVLNPPLSEKAIRARKKYIKQRQARALEERNAQETMRKKLGLKILDHVYKKYNKTGGFKCELQIAPDIRSIFSTWAEESVHDFFQSQEECWEWHRKLTAGDFLSIRSVRDQLPQELVDAYDQFQEQVEKYLNPLKFNKILEEDRQVEEERLRYVETTVADLTKLCLKVDAPMDLIRKAVRMAGFTNSMGRPRPIKLLIPLEDSDIIKWYAGVGTRWLDFFSCCHNFKMVKTIVSYHLRFSCILTLAEKHESTKHDAIRHYSKDLKVTDVNGVEEVHFPIESTIKMMGDKNLSDPKPVDGVLCIALVRLASDEPSSCCVAHFCDRLDTVSYRLRLLQNRLNVDPFNYAKWVYGIGAIHESLDRKCLPLCSRHISELYLGRISLQDIDCTAYSDSL